MHKKRKSNPILTLLSGLGLCCVLLSNVAHADLDQSMDQMCEKIKTCGKAELAKQDMSAEMQQMMIGMFDGMCQSMFAPHMMTVGKAGLEDKAEACVDSMVDASCDELMADSKEFTSAACEEFEQAAKAAGIAQ